MTQPDLFSARAERYAALHGVWENSMPWSDQALAAIKEYPNAEATGEDIRLFVEQRVGHPHHHNAYGALVKNAIRAGYLVFAGRYTNMKTRKSHARRTPVYWVKK